MSVHACNEPCIGGFWVPSESAEIFESSYAQCSVCGWVPALKVFRSIPELAKAMSPIYDDSDR